MKDINKKATKTVAVIKTMCTAMEDVFLSIFSPYGGTTNTPQPTTI